MPKKLSNSSRHWQWQTWCIPVQCSYSDSFEKCSAAEKAKRKSVTQWRGGYKLGWWLGGPRLTPSVRSVQYLPGGPGCRRDSGGVREGDGLQSDGLCCCLKNGLSKRPGKRETGPWCGTRGHPHTHTHRVTDTDATVEDQSRETEGKKPRDR